MIRKWSNVIFKAEDFTKIHDVPDPLRKRQKYIDELGLDELLSMLTTN